ncbi:MAG: hypothetical protein CVV34_01720 [Methanomicrobiales archaeon HGW-Methanomicrobiales-5]|nr:MAG: hypothetical protein CVV34_01720 [Methanomicrobiales archaeon HGW-Methanomicrobiales-5]
MSPQESFSNNHREYPTTFRHYSPTVRVYRRDLCSGNKGVYKTKSGNSRKPGITQEFVNKEPRGTGSPYYILVNENGALIELGSRNPPQYLLFFMKKYAIQSRRYPIKLYTGMSKGPATNGKFQ